MSSTNLPSEGEVPAADLPPHAESTLPDAGTETQTAEIAATISDEPNPTATSPEIATADAAEDSAGDAPRDSTEEPDDELSLAEASELVGVSTRALRDRVQRGSLPARKVTREGRVLSVVRRSDLMEIYGWMVAEGERKRQAEDAGVRTGAGSKSLEDPLGDAAQKLRQEVDKLQRALVDVTAEMRLVREAHARQREQDQRARADHEREVRALQERAAALADELKAQRRSSSMGRTPWEMVSVVLLLTVVVVGLWVRFQVSENERFQDLQGLQQQLTELIDQVGEAR